MVSHDREFLNHVVTSTLAFEGEGQVNEYVGGYDDWLRQRKIEAEPAKEKKEKPRREEPDSGKRKLSYNELRQREIWKQELADLPARIEILEQEQADLHQKMADPAFYQQNAENITRAKNRLDEIETELAQVYERWEELEGILSE